MSGISVSLFGDLPSPHSPSFSRGPAARTPRGAPPLALALSGALHLSILAFFVTTHAWTRSVVAPPEVEIHMKTFPPSTVHPIPIDVKGGGGRQDTRGVITPRENDPPDQRVLTPPDITAQPINGVMPGETSSRDRGAGPEITLPPSRPSEAPRPYDKAPVPTYAPEPAYPEIAREAGIEGPVVIEALVTREGSVARVKARSGNPMLVESALKAIATWRFRPAEVKGTPVDTWVEIPVTYRLR